MTSLRELSQECRYPETHSGYEWRRADQRVWHCAICHMPAQGIPIVWASPHAGHREPRFHLSIADLRTLASFLTAESIGQTPRRAA